MELWMINLEERKLWFKIIKLWNGIKTMLSLKNLMDSNEYIGFF